MPAASRRGVFIVFEGRTPDDPDVATAPGGERGATRRQLRAAGRTAAISALPLPGWLLLPLTCGGAWVLVDQPGAPLAVLWTASMLVWAAAMTLAPRIGRSQPKLNPRIWPTLLGLGGAMLALPLWWAPPDIAAAGALAVTAWTVATAAVTAPWRHAVLAVVGASAFATAGAAWRTGVDGHWASLLAGVVATVAAAGIAWVGHGNWMRRERRALMLEARNRLLLAERDQALRADEDKSRFVAIASHDLRQPVHALGLFAATLQKRLQHSPDAALVRHFLRAVDDLERSFSAMLDISRLDGGALAPRMHTFPLRDLFRRLHMQYAGQAELSGLGLRFSTGGKSVTSDPQLLERIVGNLIQNAIKYTAQGGVVVVARSTQTHVNVEVWDTGVGMAAAELPRVFQEFYQLAPGKRDRSHGLGMGLAIVKRLARLLGHRLEVASAPGRGTMFRVGIAIGALPGIQDELAPADTLPMSIQTPQMVLIVDDEEPIREGLRLLLQEWGYQTITAANAAEADEAVQALEGRIDLVLSDIQLDPDPDQPDGLAVVDNVRRLCGYPVPAVLVTGDTSQQTVQALAARGDPVLFKPVQPRRLIDALRAALG